MSKVKWFLAVQGLTILLSLTAVIVKFASLSMQENGFWAAITLMFIACYCVILVIYAFFWQKVIARLQLSTAYYGKSLSVFWSLVWAVFFFGEVISVQNIIGALLIVAGMIMVMRDEL
jgi:drug/metabolite transporter (DMT)-like permease